MEKTELVSLQVSDGNDRQCVFENDHVQVMRVRLARDEALPTHKANANALLVPLEGVVTVEAEGRKLTAPVGQAVSVAYDTKMDVSNGSDEAVVFLVVKTPHPKQFGGTSA